MSRAFVRESDVDTINLPDRPLSAHPNFVTPAGLAAIERALNRFNAAHTAAVDKDDKAAIASARRELRYWAARRASAQVIEPPLPSQPNAKVGEAMGRAAEVVAPSSSIRTDGGCPVAQVNDLSRSLTAFDPIPYRSKSAKVVLADTA